MLLVGGRRAHQAGPDRCQLKGRTCRRPAWQRPLCLVRLAGVRRACAAGLAASCAPVFVTAGRGAPDGPAARRPRQRSSRGRARRRAAAASLDAWCPPWPVSGRLRGALPRCAGPRSAGPGAAGMAGDLMGVNDVRVARVERQWRLLPAGRSGAAPADADLPHRRSPFRRDCGCAGDVPGGYHRGGLSPGVRNGRRAARDAGAGLAVAGIENSHSISPVGVRFCPARYEAPRARASPEGALQGWNLRWRHRARKCRSARCRDWQRRQPVGQGRLLAQRRGLHLQVGRP